MVSLKVEPATDCHVVVVAYQARSHHNAMLTLCKQLASRSDGILITYVVTKELVGLIGSDPKPENIRFITVPMDFIPSDQHGGSNSLGFFHAVSTKLEGPFEQLLDGFEPPVSVVVADTYLIWAVGVGNRRNIPVASFWPMSASVFSVIFHFDLFRQNGHYPVELSGMCVV